MAGESQERLNIQVNDLDRLNETFRTKGWSEIIKPVLEDQFTRAFVDLMAGNGDKLENVIRMQEIYKLFESIGIKMEKGLNAKSHLNKKLTTQE